MNFFYVIWGYQKEWGYQEKLNPSPTNVSLLYPVKTPQNRSLTDVFRGYRNGTYIENGLILKKPNKTKQTNKKIKANKNTPTLPPNKITIKLQNK